MSSYNNTIVPKIVDYVRYITDRIAHGDGQEREVKLLKYILVESDISNIDDLRISEQTEAFEIHFKFEIIDKEGNSTIQTDELFVPKMINNVFIIEGKTRIPTATLDNSDTCRVYGDAIVINEDIRIGYRWNDRHQLRVKFELIDENGEELTFYEEDEHYETFKDYLKLSDEERLKLQVKLDLPKVGPYLTKDIVHLLIDKGVDILQDSIIDKKINTTEENLLTTLYRRNTRTKILSSTKRKFRQYGKIFLKDIQNTITRYFRVADEDTIEIPSKVNPLVFDSLRNKITLPPYTAYNETFTDLIDVVNTPENTNVNRINEMNVCSTVEDGKVFILCYDFKTGEKKKVRYLEYLNSVVLLNIHYDYETNSVIEGNEYYYKLRLKEYKVKSLKGLKIDYIEPKPDEKLSISSRRIPMINISDSVRGAMGVSMSKQALEVENSEPRLVQSGNDDTDYIDSSLSVKYNGANPIVIESIMDKKIFYRDKVTGSIAFFTVENPIVGANDAVITFTPKVKVGDELNSGDLVIIPSILKNNTYDLGKNTLVFYMSYMGYTYEDGIVVSESYAKKMTHYSLIDVSINVKSKDIIRYLRKIGSRVASKDILVNMQASLRGRASTNEAFVTDKGVMNFLDLKYNKMNLVTPNNVDEGYVVDVLIQQTPKNPIESEYTLKSIDEFLSNPKVDEYKDIPDKFKDLKVSPVDYDPRFSACITYKIVKVNPVKIGDKMSNSWGSKGIVSLILPDDEMPYRESDGRIADMLLNPNAVTSRKNPSQLYETVLSKLIKKVYDDINENIDKVSVSELKEKLPKLLYGKRFDKMSDEDFLENHKKGLVGYAVKVGSYSKFKLNDLFDLMKEYDVTEDDEVTSPVLGVIEQPLVTGESYMMKLYHAADYTGKVTSSVVDSESPYMGRGLYREEGQKIGEMELWSLLAYGTEGFVKEQKTDVLESHYTFLNELLLAGYVMVDEKKIPYMSNYRKKLQDLQSK